MIALRKIHKSFGAKEVLSGVDLEVGRGQTLVVVGPSGTGKSVMLQHIAGLITPDAGEVIIDGTNIIGLKARDRTAVLGRLGMLFQTGALINWMNVFENVALPLYENTDLSFDEIQTRVRKYLLLVGLNDIDEKMPSELSGGMKKRVGLARAIVREPAIILYDEPTSGLDPVIARRIDRLVKDLQEEMHITSVVVTHDLRSAFTIGDTVAMLYQGRIVAQGSPREFESNTHPFVQEFINSQFGTCNTQ